MQLYIDAYSFYINRGLIFYKIPVTIDLYQAELKVYLSRKIKLKNRACI